jgi:urease accessory protein
MDRDSKRMRGAKPYYFTDLRGGVGLEKIIAWIEQDVLLLDQTAA